MGCSVCTKRYILETTETTAMNDIRFTPDELSTLREHGVVLFGRPA